MLQHTQNTIAIIFFVDIIFIFLKINNVYDCEYSLQYAADEMGLWHNETVSVSELTYANLQEGVPCKDGKFLVPDPLSARIAPRSQPNIMLFTCMPPTRAHLKTKHLNPEW